jgi:enediyne biosynthesis protein E5
VGKLVDFLLPAHITGLACAMLLYPGDRLWPVAFAGAFAIASKALLLAPVRGRMRHFLNPSNAGIALTLVLFPSVGIAPPYQFLENLHGIADWILPLVIVATGTLLNAKLTKRIPLIGAWLVGFGAQAVVRSLVMGTPIAPTLAPMTGVAFVLFTFYMISDPGTTPAGRREQVVFGLATAAVYSALQLLHVVFGLFFALAIVCVVRGAGLHAIAAREARARGRVLEPLPSMAEAPR